MNTEDSDIVYSTW